MELDYKEQWFLDVVHQLDDFCKRVDEKIYKELQQLKACKKKTELETKLAQEMKTNMELKDRLTELSRRGGELDRVCASFETNLTIADSDQNRLETAKETYQIAKELTGIRFDFTAPPNVAKGYIKSETRKLLQPFEVTMATSDDALWTILHSTFTCDKENKPDN